MVQPIFHPSYYPLIHTRIITWAIETLWKTMAFLKSWYTISRLLFTLLLGSLSCLSTFYVLSFCIRAQQGVPYLKPYSFLLRKDELTPYQKDQISLIKRGRSTHTFLMGLKVLQFHLQDWKEANASWTTWKNKWSVRLDFQHLAWMFCCIKTVY